MERIPVGWRAALAVWGVLCLLSLLGWVALGVSGSGWTFPYWLFGFGVMIVWLLLAVFVARSRSAE
ncbi:hypothetical protein GCM10022243_43770 [Saccharothrix violaceirubra]|uniref:Putative membrane protein n=1 Tax=Saccharothrix violaceirubra TaxID=413306 RepID=A0A7W7T3L4_9PSEU|nr:hypothetical protein [Saccharothrix violaceirubra]MBB4965666.1 putative membrane protein [Saccharothrix violaceirubra]